jgi:mannosylglucosylglycerate synthase
VAGISNSKILICHFRVGGTDGVSLEIEAWKKILQGEGATVELLAGPMSHGADYTVELFENQLNQTIFQLDEEAFGGFKKMTEEEFVKKFTEVQEQLTQEFRQVLAKSKPDKVVVSNVFAVGENLAAAGALCKALDEVKVRVLLVNHDFWWEGVRYHSPSCEFVQQQLDEYLPPVREYMRYCTINHIAKEAVRQKKGIESGIMYDTLDFTQQIPEDEFYKKLMASYGVTEGDIVVLQATRVVRRKNIELAVDLVKRIEEKLAVRGTIQLYDGRKFDPEKNRVILVASGYAEKRDEKYLEQLKKYAEERGVKAAFMNGVYQGHEEGLTPILKLHKLADMVTYPSEYEGFGNQFLEAIYSKKPVAVFQYPVFITDLAPKGFKFIDLGTEIHKDEQSELVKLPKEVLDAAAEHSVAVLMNKQLYVEMTELNFRLGAENFGYGSALTTFKQMFEEQPTEATVQANVSNY